MYSVQKVCMIVFQLRLGYHPVMLVTIITGQRQLERKQKNILKQPFNLFLVIRV